MYNTKHILTKYVVSEPLYYTQVYVYVDSADVWK